MFNDIDFLNYVAKEKNSIKNNTGIFRKMHKIINNNYLKAFAKDIQDKIFEINIKNKSEI
ncbi:hypothetical protein [Mycoplasmopsis cynos]|nr:hypothetical protein [Mycoplasmopsis cynos]MCU9932475.1 hypothetical protein [Mycoplasmopsis cynos]WQQ12890.1 hypothetical protein RRG58_02855 [Mycoplasmopsis cynos]WQQ13779.1 hypothetical protein RRG52_03435 [Mycoplasmopsis cynos]WQQ17370.1 hypothetical protein RRG56_02325 [Mycoplasmopsis cynos]